MQVHYLLENSAQKYPDKKAVWYKEEWRTYSEIDSLSNKLGGYLKEVGIKRGDRVVLLYENSFNHIISYFAILKAGGVCVALNTETTVDFLIYLINNSDAKAIISNTQCSKYLLPSLKKTPYLKQVIIDQEDLNEYIKLGHINQISLNEILKNGKETNLNVRSIDIDLEAIVYTSGSTGKPKGVMLTHLNTVSNMRSIVQYLHLTKDDRVMVVLPFYYIYGKSLLMTHFLVGGSVVIDNRFTYPNAVLKTMQKTEVTGFAGVPSTFMILLNKSSLNQYTFKSLRYITQAGGAMAPSVQKEVVKAFSPAKVYIMYGATEAAPRLSYVEPDMLPKKWGSIGKPVPNVELYVADNTGREVKAGETGEIVARGSNIMAGYWRDPEGTKEVLKDGIYYTSDLGKVDKDGFLYVVGRKKDFIKVGGFKVSAKEIEERILELDEVHETAVIGVNDTILGEAVKAFIVAKEKININADTINKHLKGKLPPYEIPKYYEFRKILPKNESGKILKQKLIEENRKRGENTI